MPEKLKLKIIKVEDEETQDGILTYKMTLKSKKGTYLRGVRASHWDNNEQAQRSIKKTWLKEIAEMEAEKAIKESKTKEELKAELAAKKKSIKDTVIEDE